MFAYIFANSIVAAALVVALLRRIRPTFEARLLWPMLRVGAPLVFAALASNFLNVGDRYLLKLLADVQTVAIYELAAKIAGVFNMLIVASFQLAFAVVGVKIHSESAEAGSRLYARVFRDFSIVGAWGVLGLSLLAPAVIAFVAEDAMFVAAETLVYPYALGFLFYGLFYVFVNVLFANEKTVAIATIVGLAAILNLVLNLILIPVLGGMGAAVATLFAYAFLALLAYLRSRTEVAVDHEFGILFLALGLASGLYFAVQMFAPSGSAGALAAATLAVVLYPVLIVVLRLYTLADMKGLIGMLRGRPR